MGTYISKWRGQAPFRPKEDPSKGSATPPRFALQALRAGASLAKKGEPQGEWNLTPKEWQIFWDLVAKLCLPKGGGGRGHLNFTQAPPDKCLVAKAPSLKVCNGAPGWLEGATFGVVGRRYWGVTLSSAHTTQDNIQWWKHESDRALALSQTGPSSTTPPLCNDASLLLEAGKTGPTYVHHLLTYWMRGAPPGNKIQACHFHCDQPLCLNPHHLSWGDHADNAMHNKWLSDNKKDKKRKGHPPMHCSSRSLRIRVG